MRLGANEVSCPQGHALLDFSRPSQSEQRIRKLQQVHLAQETHHIQGEWLPGEGISHYYENLDRKYHDRLMETFDSIEKHMRESPSKLLNEPWDVPTAELLAHAATNTKNKPAQRYPEGGPFTTPVAPMHRYGQGELPSSSIDYMRNLQSRIRD